MLPSTKKTCSGPRVLLLVSLYVSNVLVQGQEVCKDNHETCPTIEMECTTSESVRLLCRKTCGTCVPDASILPDEETAMEPSPDIANAPREKTYVGFVVDDTGSMGNEIGGVKLWIESCLSGALDGCGEKPTGGWVITSFNDPEVGTVIGPSTNPTDINDAARSYTANGGGDCPEMAFSGLEVAVNAVPNVNGGCKIFFFTDATAKDFDKVASVGELYEEKGCAFTSVLTGCCGDCPPPEDTVDPEFSSHVADSRASASGARAKRSTTEDDIKTLFYKLSEKTGGNIYVMDKPSSAEVMLEFLNKTVTLGFCPTNDIAGPGSGGYKCEEDCTAMNMCWDKSVSKCYCVDTILCARIPIPSEKSRCPEWSAWSSWSTCTASCEGGTRHRERRCSIEGKCRHMRPGNEQTEACNVERCPEWSNWTAWGECSKSCREGERTKSRTCSVPEKCTGDSVETEKCTVAKLCPGDGIWSKCSKSCGDGTRKRYHCDGDNCAWNFEACSERRCPNGFCSLFGKYYRYGQNHECCSSVKRSSAENCGQGVTRKSSYKTTRWPWMVAVHTNSGVCGGVLISNNFVLSTAQCFTHDSGLPKNTTDWRIVIGSQKLSDLTSAPGSAISIKRTYIHPSYDFPVADLVLVELQREVPLTRALQPICLPSGEKTRYDLTCITTGWRNNAISESRTDHLKEFTILNYDPLVCAEAYNKHEDLKSYVPFLKQDKGYMCAGSLSKHIDSCQDGIGGPLMCQRCNSCSWYVAGIVAFGPNACRPDVRGVPTVYSNIAYYEDWILTTTGMSKHSVSC